MSLMQAVIETLVCILVSLAIAAFLLAIGLGGYLFYLLIHVAAR